MVSLCCQLIQFCQILIRRPLKLPEHLKFSRLCFLGRGWQLKKSSVRGFSLESLFLLFAPLSTSHPPLPLFCSPSPSVVSCCNWGLCLFQAMPNNTQWCCATGLFWLGLTVMKGIDLPLPWPIDPCCSALSGNWKKMLLWVDFYKALIRCNDYHLEKERDATIVFQ